MNAWIHRTMHLTTAEPSFRGRGAPQIGLFWYPLKKMLRGRPNAQRDPRGVFRHLGDLFDRPGCS